MRCGVSFGQGGRDIRDFEMTESSVASSQAMTLDEVVDGVVDEDTGVVTFDESGDAQNYGVADEIPGRALRTGAKVAGVRKGDIPRGQSLAPILRSPH
jgi:hypothetical protein